MKQAVIVSLIISIVVSIAILVAAEPVATFTVSAGEKPYTVVLDATASTDADSMITAYQWTFGDGYTGSGKMVVHTYADAGSYVVTLVVFDAAHAIGRVQHTAVINGDGTLQPQPAPTVTRANAPVGLDIGDVAPEFALADNAGKIHKLSDFLGKVVILEFWRSTCPHCQQAMPHLQELFDRYKDNGLVVVLIALDWDMGAAQSYLDTNGYSGFINLWDDPSRGDKRVADIYKVWSIPHTLLIDRHGVIRYSGYPTYLLNSDIAPWL